ncbi:MAG: sirohydrochlorin chelatase [Bacillota bacterium]
MKNKKVLVVVSHGSKRKPSNEEFKTFINDLNKLNTKHKEKLESGSFKLNELYTKIEGAHLEFAEPQLESVIEALIKKGYEKLEILPLFIFAGYHVLEDIPSRMKKLEENYQQLDYKILKHPAANNNFTDYIFQNIIS